MQEENPITQEKLSWEKQKHIKKILKAKEKEENIKKDEEEEGIRAKYGLRIRQRVLSIDIRPNDKCPCGSGLKAKKCCGWGKIHDIKITRKKKV